MESKFNMATKYRSEFKIPYTEQLAPSKSVDDCANMLRVKLDSWFSSHFKSLPSQSESQISPESPERPLNSSSPTRVEFTINLIKYIDKHLNLLSKPNLEKCTQTASTETSSVSTECDLQPSASCGTQTYHEPPSIKQVFHLKPHKPLKIHIPQHFLPQPSSH